MINEQLAITTLEDLGFTKYQAKCLVAIKKQDITTPKKISNKTGIPRSNIYEAAEYLAEQGLIEIKVDGRQKYRPVKTKEIIEDLKEEYNSKISDLKKALSNIKTEKIEEDGGIWTTNGRQKVINRTRNLLENAEKEIVFLASKKTSFDLYTDIIKNTVNSNIKIIVVSTSKEIEDKITKKTPKVKFINKAKNQILNEEIIKIVMIDRNKVLIANTYKTYKRPHEVTGNVCEKKNIITKILCNLIDNYTKPQK